MLRFEWNALRPDDKVLVHDAQRADLALVAGTVVLIDSHPRVNGVGIAVVSSDGGHNVLWPSSLVVHRDPFDATRPCWRCEVVVGGDVARSA